MADWSVYLPPITVYISSSVPRLGNKGFTVRDAFFIYYALPESPVCTVQYVRILGSLPRSSTPCLTLPYLVQVVHIIAVGRGALMCRE